MDHNCVIEEIFLKNPAIFGKIMAILKNIEGATLTGGYLLSVLTKLEFGDIDIFIPVYDCVYERDNYRRFLNHQMYDDFLLDGEGLFSMNKIEYSEILKGILGEPLKKKKKNYGFSKILDVVNYEKDFQVIFVNLKEGEKMVDFIRKSFDLNLLNSCFDITDFSMTTDGYENLKNLTSTYNKSILENKVIFLMPLWMRIEKYKKRGIEIIDVEYVKQFICSFKCFGKDYNYHNISDWIYLRKILETDKYNIFPWKINFGSEYEELNYRTCVCCDQETLIKITHNYCLNCNKTRHEKHKHCYNCGAKLEKIIKNDINRSQLFNSKLELSKFENSFDLKFINLGCGHYIHMKCFKFLNNLRYINTSHFFCYKCGIKHQKSILPNIFQGEIERDKVLNYCLVCEELVYEGHICGLLKIFT